MTYIAHINGSPQIQHALRTASQQTGTDFDYLLKTAIRESSLNTTAKSKTSTAQGLFQFIEQTWLATMKKSGNKYGLGHLSKSIEARSDGTYNVANPATRSAILALRDDPRISSLMAGAYTRDSAEKLQAALGRTPKQGELYIAHFMGQNGAIDLISLAGRKPHSIAAHHFPQAAAANKNIFYTETGKARSVVGVYHNLMSKHGPQSSDIARITVPSTAPIPSDVKFSASKHLASHFKPAQEGGFLSTLFGGQSRTTGGQVNKVSSSGGPSTALYKQPVQLLTNAIASQANMQNESVHVASTSVSAYQKQQVGAKVHNLFSTPSLRGTFR